MTNLPIEIETAQVLIAEQSSRIAVSGRSSALSRRKRPSTSSPKSMTPASRCSRTRRRGTLRSPSGVRRTPHDASSRLSLRKPA
jgi:hypothetical protein